MNLEKKYYHHSGRIEFYTHESSETKTPMNFSVFRPQNARTHTTTNALVWLSGLTCTEENFQIKSGAQKMANELGVYLFCPDTSPRGLDLKGEHDSYDFGSGAGFYMDTRTEGYQNHYRMESYIIQEFLPLIQKSFNINAKGVCLSGHSMGGFGALYLGTKYANHFQSVSAFSPICSLKHSTWGQKILTGYIGKDQAQWDEWEFETLFEKYRPKHHFLIDQGADDEFLKGQLQPDYFKKAADHFDISFDYREHENYDHSYYFVSSFIEDHLQFHFA
jgi:S-formylglutathione hydrolase